MEAMLREYLEVDNLRSKVDGVTGSIVLQGDHRVEVRRWLKSLGF
jgi:translation initiation factor 1 (eIF-1/SUI1)